MDEIQVYEGHGGEDHEAFGRWLVSTLRNVVSEADNYLNLPYYYIELCISFAHSGPTRDMKQALIRLCVNLDTGNLVITTNEAPAITNDLYRAITPALLTRRVPPIFVVMASESDTPNHAEACEEIIADRLGLPTRTHGQFGGVVHPIMAKLMWRAP